MTSAIFTVSTEQWNANKESFLSKDLFKKIFFDIVKNIPSVLNLAKVKIVFPSILNISNRYELHKLSIKNFLTFNSMGEGDNRVITAYLTHLFIIDLYNLFYQNPLPVVPIAISNQQVIINSFMDFIKNVYPTEFEVYINHLF